MGNVLNPFSFQQLVSLSAYKMRGKEVRSESVRQNDGKLDDKVNILLAFSKGAKMRRSILWTLQHGPKNCNQIAKKLKVDWWTVQKHLQRLEKAGLIKDVGLGRIRFYQMTLKGNLASNAYSQISDTITSRS